MGDGTGISWTDATWNPVRGCSRVSEGCRNCYAERTAARFCGAGQPYEGLAIQRKGSKWTGEVRLVPEHLADPLRWTRPRRIFVNSMSDLFHEKLSNEQIAAVFGVMAAAAQHTFQILTKRAQRMREWFAWVDAQGDQLDFCGRQAIQYQDVGDLMPWFQPVHWPLDHVWLGVSVENQEASDERIQELLATPGSVRFLSCEPLLGPIQFKPFTVGAGTYCHDCGGAGVRIDEDGCCVTCGADAYWYGVDWIIAGGESGPGARPCDVAWLRSVRDQCAAAQVPFFLKQARDEVEMCDQGCGERVRYQVIGRNAAIASCGCTIEGGEVCSPVGIGFGDDSKRKASCVIELPYLDGVQHAAFPEAPR